MGLELNNIICGDALDILKEISDNTVHLVITSPPYNIDKPYKNHNDKMNYNDYFNWMEQIWKETKRILVDGGRLCINYGENKRQDIASPPYIVFTQQCINLGMLYRGTIIWNKHNAAKHCAWGSWKNCSNPHIVPRHEYIIIFSKGKFKLEGDPQKSDMTKEEFMKFTRSIWDIAPESKKKIGHPAPFPEELVSRLVKFYSYKENVVLDMFAGSGTVGVVAKRLGRKFILIDNCKEYCKLAERRILGDQEINYSTEKIFTNEQLSQV